MNLGQLMNYEICHKLSNVCFKNIDTTMMISNFKKELIKNIIFVEEELQKINSIENASKDEKIKLGEDIFNLEVIYPMPRLMLTEDDFSSEKCYLSNNKTSWLSSEEINKIISWCEMQDKIME